MNAELPTPDTPSAATLYHVRVHGTDKSGAARTVRSDYQEPDEAGRAIACALTKSRVTRVELYILREGELLCVVEIPRVTP